ncbi:hypothetical protein K503DRAFT_799107 [Rhizopogon vinicolor AM-OR11-026]|uniref:Uncharacterized protein n=1 Tax=Rhizopogon vinicolor AM-OR11-026 TaxID=1314800 RepID=A0A1B7N5J0_9AGAM|nr:hypothetical protein K503DRAFT_799107 [Rhizopogon vinicolor AM-OR11-026]
MLVDAIDEAVHDPEALLSNFKSTLVGQRAPERYQSALHTTLSVRSKVCAHKKVSKFWKHSAQEDDRHTDTVTSSSPNLSSVREPFDHTCLHLGSAATSASSSTVQFRHAVNTSSPSKPCFAIPRVSRRRAVFGDINLDVSQSHAEPENPQHDESDEWNARPMVALSQDLIENLNRVALGRTYHQSSSVASRSSISSRLSTSVPLPSFSPADAYVHL